MNLEPSCHYCGEPIDHRSRYTWHHVEGWERPGQAGGSDITLRHRTGRAVAHDDCIRKAKAGISPAQESLVTD